MPKFNPIEVYKGEDVYVIGGGTSVSQHDLSLLKNKNVIGLNQAYAVIPEIINYCIFGDTAFFNFITRSVNKTLLDNYKGIMITNAPLPVGVNDYSWLHYFNRDPFMKKGESLGWYGNTGILGIELAITLGAKRIFLLGYDNYNADGQSHYHNYHKGEVSRRALNMFNEQFTRAHKIWCEDYPEVEIINLNPESELTMFKKTTIERV
jgi:hypothetical protein